MTDRISANPGRIKLTSETDGTSEFFTMEMADNPLETGTPLQKATLLSDTTEDLIFGDHDDRTVDEAFAELGGNRIRLPSDAEKKLYTAVIDTEHPFILKNNLTVTNNGYSMSGSYYGNKQIVSSKNYIAIISLGTKIVNSSTYYVPKIDVYSKNDLNIIVRTITIAGDYDYRTSFNFYGNEYSDVIYFTMSYSDGYRYVNLVNGLEMYQAYALDIVYDDGTFIYYLNNNAYRIRRVRLSTMAQPEDYMTLSDSISICMTNNTPVIYGLIGSSSSSLSTYKIIKIDLYNKTTDVKMVTTDQTSVVRGYELCFVDLTLLRVYYFYNQSISAGASNKTYVYGYIDLTDGHCTDVVYVPSFPSSSIGYISFSSYIGHIRSNIALLLVTNYEGVSSSDIGICEFNLDTGVVEKYIHYEYKYNSKLRSMIDKRYNEIEYKKELSIRTIISTCSDVFLISDGASYKLFNVYMKDALSPTTINGVSGRFYTNVYTKITGWNSDEILSIEDSNISSGNYRNVSMAPIQDLLEAKYDILYIT